MRFLKIKKQIGVSFLLSLLLSSCIIIPNPSNSDSSDTTSETTSETTTEGETTTDSTSDTTSETDDKKPEGNDAYRQELYANVSAWGLGEEIETYVSNDRSYDWYVDQYNTGEYWAVNCGPTSVEMAGRFSDPNFSYTAEDARNYFPRVTDWWYDINISTILKQYKIPHTKTSVRRSNDLVKELNKDGILLVNPNMSLVDAEEDPNHHVGLYYPPGTGHYIIVKGYIIVDDKLYFEVHDPWSIDMRYENGELKGRNRYYSESSLFRAISNWYSTIYTITII